MFVDLPLSKADPELTQLLARERERQNQSLHMLAPAMLSAEWLRQLMGSPAINLDGEGYVELDDLAAARIAISEDRYPNSRSQKFNPCGYFMEYAEARAKQQVASAFADDSHGAIHVNLHPVSGTSANLAALMGVAAKDEKVLGLEPASGGHISHGAHFHISAERFRFRHLSLDRGTDRFPVDRLGALLAEERPAAMILGASSYPRALPWDDIARIKQEASPETVFIADIAHFAGPVLSGHYPNPISAADVVTGVGYKSMGGPKSGFILTRRPDLHVRIARALFPGLQGAPRMTDIIAMGVAARLTQEPAFRQRMAMVIALRERIEASLIDRGVVLAFGGSDTHMLILDVGPAAPAISSRLERSGVLQNANMLPGDTSGNRPSGIRLGVIGLVQQGLTPQDGAEVADVLADVITGDADEQKATSRVSELLERGRRRLHG
jgi:glycine hydroxymethyltransferase